MSENEQQTVASQAGEIAAEAGKTTRHTAGIIGHAPQGLTVGLVVLALFSLLTAAATAWFLQSTLRSQTEAESAGSERLTEYLMQDTQNQAESQIALLRGFHDYTSVVEASRAQEVRRAQEAAKECAANMARIITNQDLNLLPKKEQIK